MATCVDIDATAGQHGHDLMLKGFTVSQVVHDYGDVCQTVTDLALESNAPISSEDFPHAEPLSRRGDRERRHDVHARKPGVTRRRRRRYSIAASPDCAILSRGRSKRSARRKR